jgi:hypothetical protein
VDSSGNCCIAWGYGGNDWEIYMHCISPNDVIGGSKKEKEISKVSLSFHSLSFEIEKMRIVNSIK